MSGEPIRDRLAGIDTRLYLVTDTAMASRAGRTVAETAAQAAAGGAGIVQVRDKELPDDAFYDLAVEVVRAVEAAREEHGIAADVPVFLNDRVEVARRMLDDGYAVHVHVGQDDWPADRVRALIGAEPLLGVSAHRPEQIAAARDAGGADLVGIGPIWDTRTKEISRDALGPAGFAALAAQAGLPAFAIGGISPANAHELHGTGAAGICVVSALMTADDPADAARRLIAAYEGDAR